MSAWGICAVMTGSVVAVSFLHTADADFCIGVGGFGSGFGSGTGFVVTGSGTGFAVTVSVTGAGSGFLVSGSRSSPLIMTVPRRWAYRQDTTVLFSMLSETLASSAEVGDCFGSGFV